MVAYARGSRYSGEGGPGALGEALRWITPAEEFLAGGDLVSHRLAAERLHRQVEEDLPRAAAVGAEAVYAPLYREFQAIFRATRPIYRRLNRGL